MTLLCRTTLLVLSSLLLLSSCDSGKAQPQPRSGIRMRDLATPDAFRSIELPAVINFEVTVMEISRHGYAQRVATIIDGQETNTVLKPQDFTANGFLMAAVPQSNVSQLGDSIVSVGAEPHGVEFASILANDSYDFRVNVMRQPATVNYSDGGNATPLQLEHGRLMLNISARQNDTKGNSFRVTVTPIWKRPYDDHLLARAGLREKVELESTKIRKDMQVGDMLVIGPAENIAGTPGQLFFHTQTDTVLVVLVICLGLM